MKHSIHISLGLVAVSLLLGCKHTGPHAHATHAPKLNAGALSNLTAVTFTNQLKSEWLRPMTNFYTLGPGDRLEIEALDDPSTKSSVLVGPDGKIHYYLLPGITVTGLTLGEAKDRIERGLSRFIQRQPRVSITLRGVASKQVWLLGRFTAPGVYTLSAPTTVLEAIAMAGGPATLSSASTAGGGSSSGKSGGGGEVIADMHRSFVIRQGEVIRIDMHRLLREGDMSQNIYLQPGDFFFLPPLMSHDIYVLGGVRLPTIVKYTESTTLISAIAYAGGTVKDSYLSHVAIVRDSLTEPKIGVVSYQDIVRGQASDVLLEPGDIVYIPMSPYRTLTRYANLILDTFVRTVGINEGARAITRQSGPVGVNVPVGLQFAP